MAASNREVARDETQRNSVCHLQDRGVSFRSVKMTHITMLTCTAAMLLCPHMTGATPYLAKARSPAKARFSPCTLPFAAAAKMAPAA
ncbi:MAG: hypothetical protein ABIP20_12590 [Chthoniobacteraceae bacterium]